MNGEKKEIKQGSVIMVDIDFHEGAIREFGRRLNFIKKVTKLPFRVLKVYVTPHGYHFYVNLGEKGKAASMSMLVILIFQLLLGSDYKRETFNLSRLLNTGEMNNILFMDNEKEEDILAEIMLNSGVNWL